MSEKVTIEHYINHVMGEITKRDVEQVSERLRALGLEEERTCHNISEDGFLCSVCSFGDFGSFKFEPNYCPNCGARVTPKNSETTPKVVSE